MPEYTELQNKFHMISGTYIAGQIFLEYAFVMKDIFDVKVKGETTKKNRLIEAESKVTKVVNMFAEELKRIGCDLKITQNEINNLQETLYAILQLEENDQKRVMGLIKKIQSTK